MAKIYFDIGANVGKSSMKFVGGDSIVYAFEPVPEMIRRLKEIKWGDYRIVEQAVSDFNGRATFYVAGGADWGCSSLAEFSDILHETWPDRRDFNVTEKIEVDVIRLDSFIEEHGIEEIEYMHCDVQGTNMEVLLGMGKHVRKVARGVVKIPTRHRTKLYKNEKYISKDMIEFLEDNGFRIDDRIKHDEYSNEELIHFSRIDDFVPVVRDIAIPDITKVCINTKPKVAVVFPGRVTCYEESFDWFKSFSDEYDLDFYCSISTALDDHYEKFIKMYDVKKYIFENRPTKYYMSDPTEYHRNTISMFLNMKTVVDLVPADTYDIIWYARADTVSSDRIDLSVALKHPNNDKAVFIPMGFDWGGVNDQMAFGIPSAMIKYSRTFENIDQYIKDGEVRNNVHPETTLKAHLNISGMEIVRFDFNYSLNPNRHVYERGTS